MKIFIFLLTLGLIFLVYGCAEVKIPTPKEVLEHPLGTESVKIGMSKDQVVDLWGEPDRVEYKEISELEETRLREVWIYRGRYSTIPVDAGYLSKTKYLYFDGNNLTKIADVDLKTED